MYAPISYEHSVATRKKSGNCRLAAYDAIDHDFTYIRIAALAWENVTMNAIGA